MAQCTQGERGQKSDLREMGEAGGKLKPRKGVWVWDPRPSLSHNAEQTMQKLPHIGVSPVGQWGYGGAPISRGSVHLHLIVAVAWLLHAVSLGKLLIELGTRHPAVRCPPYSQRHTGTEEVIVPRVFPPGLQDNQTYRDLSEGRGQRGTLPKLTISQSRTPNDHLKGEQSRL